MIDVKKIADAADVIVNGYAFTSSDGKYKILNLNRPERDFIDYKMRID